MSDEKFILEYEKLLDKGYCDCNEMNCIDNNSPRRILRIVKSLQQENKELKKQLEKKYEKLGTLTAEILYDENTRLVNEITVLKTENQKLKEMQCIFLGTGCQNKIKEYKNQQKEFIEYLEEPIKIITDGNPTNISEYTAGKLDALKEILSKYKEIIGGKDE